MPPFDPVQTATSYLSGPRPSPYYQELVLDGIEKHGSAFGDRYRCLYAESQASLKVKILLDDIQVRR